MPRLNPPPSESSTAATRDENADSQLVAPEEWRDAGAEEGRTPWLRLFAWLAAFYGVYMYGFWGANHQPKPPLVGPIAATQSRASAKSGIVVHVAGHVKHPGVYTLAPNARIGDAVQKAGGATEEADSDALNLAAWAEDGTRIEVPAKQRIAARTDQAQPATETTTEETTSSQNPSEEEAASAPQSTPEVSASATAGDTTRSASTQDAAKNAAKQREADAARLKAQKQAATQARREAKAAQEAIRKKASDARRMEAKKKAQTIAGMPRALTPGGNLSDKASPAFLAKHPLSLNRASREQLEALPGVGPGLAQKILDYRKANNGFKSVDDLDNVSGIGEKKMAALRTLVAVP